MTVQSKYAWPDKQYDGNVLGYEEHATDLQTWLIERGYDEFMTEVNPRTIPREPQNRQVQHKVTIPLILFVKSRTGKKNTVN